MLEGRCIDIYVCTYTYIHITYYIFPQIFKKLCTLRKSLSTHLGILTIAEHALARHATVNVGYEGFERFVCSARTCQGC